MNDAPSKKISVKCPHCKVDLKKTGLNLQSCSKCHHLFYLVKRKNQISILCDKCSQIGEHAFSAFNVSAKEIACQFCKRKIKVHERDTTNTKSSSACIR